MGSFVSQDPLGLAAGDNVYEYSPNVWGWIDPLGLCNTYHTVPSAGAGQSVLNGIDPKFLNPESRFGKALYISDDAETTLAELAEHKVKGTHTIRFSLNEKSANILDLSNPTVAKAYGYSGGPITDATKAIGTNASKAGYNVIKFPSLRGTGTNYAVLKDFDKVLTPQMISPTP